jgi:hypothetical protein
MAEFKDKLIEAYFTNNEKSTICAVYKGTDDKGKEVAVEHHLTVDPDEYYYQELMKEVDIEEIEEHTQKRLEVYTENLKKLVKKWSMAEPKDWDPKQVDTIVNHRLMKFVFDWDKDDKQLQEMMFRMKLRIFEKDSVKDSKNADGKAMIRKAEEPIDVLIAYARVIGKI